MVLLGARTLAAHLAGSVVARHSLLTPVTNEGHWAHHRQWGQIHLCEDCWKETIFEEDCRVYLAIEAGTCQFV